MAYSKVTLNGETLMDVTSDTVEANKLLTGEIATAANGQKVTGTLVTSNDFVITLTQNQNGDWEPDCTYAEAVAAYNAGKKVAFIRTDGEPCRGSYDDFDNAIFYGYFDYYSESNNYGEKSTNYIWDSTGITKDLVSIYYDTGWSNATPSEVLQGKTFHNANGAQTGTATSRSSSDLTVSGATVTAPAGFYSAAATKSVTSGTTGTPTATKGTVSNHSVSVTPSVTNTTGYITGGTKTGTAITVSASELVSGTKSITENGTGIDVTNYANVDVDVESDDFVITLSYNNSTEKWEPDCTYAEAYAAYQAGKNIVFTEENNGICKGLYQLSSNYFEYFIDVVNYDGSRNLKTIEYAHSWSSSGISGPDITEYYYTGYADAVSANVLSGKKFFNGDGYQVGTATSRSSSDLTVSGATVTAPAGYYANAATKSVTSGSVQTPATTITANPTITVNSSGLITASASTSKAITPTVSAGYVSSGTAGTITINGSKTSQLSTQASTTIAPTESTQTAVASGKYTTGDVKIGAIPTTYVGSGIAQKTSSNLTVSGATVTAPAGYYAAAATKSVASGTAGTPTATKGSVSNYSISVTPSVTNTTGYITGGTKTGTAVTVSASELVSGTKSITENGTGIDVKNYANVNVNISQKRTATIKKQGMYGSGNYSYVLYNSQNYYIKNATFEFTPGSNLYIGISLSSQQANDIIITIDNIAVVNTTEHDVQYNYTLPDHDIDIFLDNDQFQNYVQILDVSLRKTDEEWIRRYDEGLSQVFSNATLLSMRLGAFAETKITGATFEKVTVIPSQAFYSCTSLTTINFPNAQTIRMQAFYWNINLINVNCPLVSIVGTSAFDGCSKLQSISMPELKRIYDYGFDLCSALETLYAPQLSQVDAYGLANCYSLKNINTESISIIYSNAFYKCSAFESLSFPALTRMYGTSTFAYCINLSTFSAPVLSSALASGAFSYCSNLTNVYIPLVNYIPQSVFVNLTKLKTVNISNASTISSYAFQGCTSLISVINFSVKTIGTSAFQSTLISKFIGQNLYSLFSGAFSNCSYLEKVIFGSSFYSLNSHVFQNCYKLISLYLLNTSSVCRLVNPASTTFLSTPIYDYSNIAGRLGSIYVPASLYSIYKTSTNWTVLADRFVSLTDAQIQQLLAES